MNYSFKEILGAVAVALSVAAYFPYLISIIKQQTQPHIFSWIVWTLTTGIAFAAQISRGAGPGAWTTCVTVLFHIIIVISAIGRGEKTITLTDWISFLFALTAIPIWYFTDDPLGAVLIASVITLFGSYPTIRKTAVNPRSESALFWVIVSLRSVAGILAIEIYSLNTTLAVAVNGLVNLIIMLQVAIGRMRVNHAV